MKLELKHIAPYLPYGLKIKVKNDSSVIFTMSGIDCLLNSVNYCKNSWYESSTRIEHIKPILRPLSDLTKEIEVNGENFVHLDILQKKFNKTLLPYLFFNGNISLDIQTENYSQAIDLFDGYLIIQKLLEWHFDVFNLIENNLAIDINTLKS